MPELMGLGDTILSSLLPFAGWLDGQNAIRVGLFMLLISLLVSCRRNSGLPSFIVSGACVSLSGAWWAIRVLLGGRFGECICATPMMLLIMASWFTFLDTVLPFDRSKALRRHMMVILGLVIMESFTIAVTDISDSGWEGSVSSSRLPP